jgi:hypothetical protein
LTNDWRWRVGLSALGSSKLPANSHISLTRKRADRLASEHEWKVICILAIIEDELSGRIKWPINVLILTKYERSSPTLPAVRSV